MRCRLARADVAIEHFEVHHPRAGIEPATAKKRYGTHTFDGTPRSAPATVKFRQIRSILLNTIAPQHPQERGMPLPIQVAV